MASLAAEQWAKARTFHHSLYPAARIAAERKQSVSVCLPARECAQTIGEIVRALTGLLEVGVIDELLVVDAASRDGTAEIAERAGARVVQEREILPDVGPVFGKGDAMWRGLSVLSGELVVFLDADSENFSEHFATGLLGPLVCEPGVAFVKAFYRRPFERDGISLPDEGGRVNHLMARPALSLFYPELAAVRQPLAGEVAARRELLERVPFVTGYGVEIAMLIDVWRAVGLDGIAQVDLDVHRNRHQPLAALSEMSQTVLATIVRRLVSEGRLSMEGLDGRSGRGPEGASCNGRSRPFGSGREGEQMGAVAAPSERPLYLDLDGTLLGRGASLVHDGEGNVSLAGMRAIEACLRAQVEVVLMSGRRRMQVAEDARLLGQSAYIFEAGACVVLGAGQLGGTRVTHDERSSVRAGAPGGGEEHWLTGEMLPGESTIAQQIERSGAPAMLLERYQGRLEYHEPWHVDREVSHLFRGLVDAFEVDELLAEQGHGGLRLVDNGVVNRRSAALAELPHVRGYHLVPAGASKAGAVAFHRRVRGYAREQTFAVGDSREDLACAEHVGSFWLVANAVERDPSILEAAGAFENVRIAEAGHGGGVYEAVVSTLVGSTRSS